MYYTYVFENNLNSPVQTIPTVIWVWKTFKIHERLTNDYVFAAKIFLLFEILKMNYLVCLPITPLITKLVRKLYLEKETFYDFFLWVKNCIHSFKANHLCIIFFVWFICRL